MLAWWTLAPLVWAQNVENDRPTVPAASLAAENGPGALWVNPANLAYDPDPRFGVAFARNFGESPTSLAATVGIGGIQVGVHNLRRPTGGTLDESDWSLDLANSLPLPKRISVGWVIGWNLVQGGRNFVAFDAALSWRPLPWVGISAVTRNIGNPDPRAIQAAQSGVGIALRPGRALVFGVDYLHDYSADPLDLLSATLRVRPVQGLYFRAQGETSFGAEGVALHRVGLGLEVYFSGMGVMAYGATDLENTGLNTWFQSDEPGESLFRSGRKIAALSMGSPPPYTTRPSILFADPAETWLDTLELMRRLEKEPDYKGLVLTLGSGGLDSARWRELRERVVALEAAGKPVLVYLNGDPGNGAVYVASAARRVLVHPAVDVGLTGYAAEIMNLRGALDLVGIEPEFVKRREYKAAPEQFTELEPSAPALEQTNALLDDLHGELVSAVASGRKRSEEEVRGWVDGGPWTAREAVSRGIADAVAYPDEIEGALEQLLNIPDLKVKRLEDLPQPRSAWDEPSKIAVLYIEGPIVPGESATPGIFGLGAQTTGSATVVRQLERAQTDDQVKAVVLRVDSPGGSSYASDEIWRAVELVKREGKPVVVSMGGVAASGGYYVACGADAIWAEPTTITGSIGVFSGKFNAERLFETVGVGTTMVTRGRNAGYQTLSRPWDAVERARMEAIVDEIYGQFKDHVAEGRGLKPEQVEEVARGRVWSGKRAKEVGLVDELGGLQEAIVDARTRAKIPKNQKVALVTVSPDGFPFESLAPTLLPTTRLARKAVLGDIPELDLLRRVTRPLDPWWLWTSHPEENLWMMPMDPITVVGE